MSPNWTKFLVCFEAEHPFLALKELRTSLIVQGGSQHYVYDVFSEFLAHCQNTPGLDSQETDDCPAEYVRNILDGIVGWCAKDYWAFPTKPYYCPRPELGMTKEQVKETFKEDPDYTKQDIWVYGLHEYHFDTSGKLFRIHHQGLIDGIWTPPHIKIKEFDQTC